MHPNTAMLLASIDHTLASVRAALAAAADPQQTGEARTELAGKAGADLARLVASSRDAAWADMPPPLAEAMERTRAAADQGDLARAERELATAREQIGGPSR